MSSKKVAPRIPSSNTGGSLRSTPARVEAEQRRLAEKEEKQKLLAELLNQNAQGQISEKDKKTITKLQKQLGIQSFSEAVQTESETVRPATNADTSAVGSAVPEVESHIDTTGNASEHAKRATNGVAPGTRTAEPTVNSQTKPQYSESGTEDGDGHEQNPRTHSQGRQAPSSSPGAKEQAVKARRKKATGTQSNIVEAMRKAGVEVVEEGFITVGSNIWMVYGYGLPNAAKYEMKVLGYCDENKLKTLQWLSSTGNRISQLKNENGRRQYSYDNIESLDAATVLPYGRRKGKRGLHDNETVSKKPRFRLTLVQVKWRNLLPEHKSLSKNGRTWEPRSDLLGMVREIYKAQLDREIFELCGRQDVRYESWLKDNQKSHLAILKRPPTPLPGKLEWISDRNDARKEAARTRTARQRPPGVRSSEDAQRRAKHQRNGPKNKRKRRDGQKEDEDGDEDEDEEEEESEDDKSDEEEGRSSASGKATSKSPKGSRVRIQNAEGVKPRAPEKKNFSYLSYLFSLLAPLGMTPDDLDKEENKDLREKWDGDWEKFKKDMEKDGWTCVGLKPKR
ncbi:uncharacterized protein N7446_003972 [Penicillium canescens]|uniref:Uncharacterized protein n=1 Tax=Penicillium canescens TaxID=5083 RepID=A0AAD6N3K0_PENCN|nr:uncharacterized protein N7446_003972 [Penicillium canescens]KAJ6027434.1 hypothetical protein N7460_012251 [Penicillium canescens]KAJ6040712.1 hypothetical protein N7444_009617 [Penicillium canescens]KAJ6066935.1 hypothetical protein N7446_003972 [Penicillium canescens]